MNIQHGTPPAQTSQPSRPQPVAALRQPAVTRTQSADLIVLCEPAQRLLFRFDQFAAGLADRLSAANDIPASKRASIEQLAAQTRTTVADILSDPAMVPICEHALANGEAIAQTSSPQSFPGHRASLALQAILLTAKGQVSSDSGSATPMEIADQTSGQSRDEAPSSRFSPLLTPPAAAVSVSPYVYSGPMADSDIDELDSSDADSEAGSRQARAQCHAVVPRRALVTANRRGNESGLAKDAVAGHSIEQTAFTSAPFYPVDVLRQVPPIAPTLRFHPKAIAPAQWGTTPAQIFSCTIRVLARPLQCSIENRQMAARTAQLSLLTSKQFRLYNVLEGPPVPFTVYSFEGPIRITPPDDVQTRIETMAAFVQPHLHRLSLGYGEDLKEAMWLHPRDASDVWALRRTVSQYDHFLFGRSTAAMLRAVGLAAKTAEAEQQNLLQACFASLVSEGNQSLESIEQTDERAKSFAVQFRLRQAQAFAKDWGQPAYRFDGSHEPHFNESYFNSFLFHEAMVEHPAFASVTFGDGRFLLRTLLREGWLN